MPPVIKVTPWGKTEQPTEPELRQLLKEQGLDFYAWSNGPFDVYAPHRHGYDKVLYCVSGSITFQLAEVGMEIRLLPGDRLDLPAGVLHGAEVGARGVTCLEGHG